MPERIVVVGMPGDRQRVRDAALVVGAARHLEDVGLEGVEARRLLVFGAGGVAADEALVAIATEPRTVGVLASGDPGFFGIVRSLAARFGSERLEVHPAPSSVSLAFARLGLPWDDAVVVSAHGRSLDDAADLAASGGPKVAVLAGPDAPPEALGKELIARDHHADRVVVCSRLGEPDEEVVDTDLNGLAADTYDPLSVTLLLQGDGVAAEKVLAWGRPERAFLRRAGLITKSEVRAVVLARLELPERGLLWDVGAGSGSVGVEAASLVAGVRVVAVERRPDDCARVSANAAAAGVGVEVVEGEAPDVLAGLPDPDRAFVGGGGIEVLDAVLARLRPGGRVVATFAALDRAVEAFRRLGSMVQVAVARAEPLGGGVRLAAEHPVFVCWGPS